MNVLHVAAGSLSDGAARGAYWLHQGLLQRGVNSHFLLQEGKESDGANIVPVARTAFERCYHALIRKLENGLTKMSARSSPKRAAGNFSAGCFGINPLRESLYRNIDLIHLHWISSGLISIRFLNRIVCSDTPVVWTLRDMWPFTGGCHYTLGCTRYLGSCGACPVLGSTTPNDLSSRMLRRKREAYGGKLYPVAVSNWLRECAVRSSVFRDSQIAVIPNGVPTNRFFPEDKERARHALKIPSGRPVALAGAQWLNQAVKGPDYLTRVIPDLAEAVHFVLFGRQASQLEANTGLRLQPLGFLTDDDTLRLAYSAADVLITPSTQEACGKTPVEAMACGTPVVAFDATGQKDIVEHGRTGYLAKPFSSDDLAAGVRWVLADAQRHRALCAQARHRAVEKFSVQAVARQYTGFYVHVLADTRCKAGNDRR